MAGPSGKPRLAIVLPTLNGGGAEKVVVDLARALRKDWEIRFLLTNPDSSEDVYAPALAEAGVPVERLPVFQMEPGLIATHTAVYVGRKVAGRLGAFVAACRARAVRRGARDNRAGVSVAAREAASAAVRARQRGGHHAYARVFLYAQIPIGNGEGERRNKPDAGDYDYCYCHKINPL